MRRILLDALITAGLVVTAITGILGTIGGVIDIIEDINILK